MDTYIYSADMYCSSCGEKIRQDIDAERKEKGLPPIDRDDDTQTDSDDYPKGPYSDGGGESDSPQHCGSCDEFLENPLTGDGVAYVAESIIDAIGKCRWDSIAITVWAEYYELDTIQALKEAMEYVR